VFATVLCYLHWLMTTTPTVQQQSLPRELFGLTVKHAAVIFAVIYGIGFLVLSVHHARFGMEATEPFKPKVFSAGLLFVVLAGVPCIAMARTLAMFGLRMPVTRIVKGQGEAYVGLLRVLRFWLIALGPLRANISHYCPAKCRRESVG